ncbi:MAG TPA: hypothetical protein VL793_11840 [Patescibacteria group bacterium]|nr:hypothetical protein [Patescibacteria group bacterium]
MLGNWWGGDQKIRNYAVLGSILPDIDALPYVFEPYYYWLDDRLLRLFGLIR